VPRLRRRDQTRPEMPGMLNLVDPWPGERARATPLCPSSSLLLLRVMRVVVVFVVMIINAFYFFHVTDNRFPGGVGGKWWETGEAAVIFSTTGDHGKRERVVVVVGGGPRLRNSMDQISAVQDRIVCADESIYTSQPTLWVMSPAGNWRARVTYRRCIILLWCTDVVVVINLLLHQQCISIITVQ